jgi:hypothetical protein
LNWPSLLMYLFSIKYCTNFRINNDGSRRKQEWMSRHCRFRGGSPMLRRQTALRQSIRDYRLLSQPGRSAK